MFKNNTVKIIKSLAIILKFLKLQDLWLMKGLSRNDAPPVNFRVWFSRSIYNCFPLPLCYRWKNMNQSNAIGLLVMSAKYMRKIPHMVAGVPWMPPPVLFSVFTPFLEYKYIFTKFLTKVAINESKNKCSCSAAVTPYLGIPQRKQKQRIYEMDFNIILWSPLRWFLPLHVNQTNISSVNISCLRQNSVVEKKSQLYQAFLQPVSAHAGRILFSLNMYYKYWLYAYPYWYVSP